MPKIGSHLRELSKAPEEKQAKELELAIEKASKEDRQPIAKDYKAAVEELTAKPKPKVKPKPATPISPVEGELLDAPSDVPPTSMSEPGEEYEDFEPPEEEVESCPALDLDLADHLEPIRDKLLTHFAADELPTSESHYKAIARLGVEGAVDVVELAREQMTGDSPKLQDYRDAAKSLDSKYARSILLQHLEAAMRATDDLNRHTPNAETHAKVMQGVQMSWEDVKGWK